MKNSLLSPVLLLFVFIVNAQTFTGDYIVNIQQDLADFNYTEITGDLIISSTDLTNLSGLNTLETISGSLIISNNETLNSIDAFNNLQSIGDNLLIQFNNMLSSVAGFENLVSIDNDILLEDNLVLSVLPTFMSLTDVGGTININYNSSLTNINGFSVLQTLGSSPYSGQLLIFENNALISIDAFSNLQSSGLIAFHGNPLLSSITGFENLATVNEHIFIIDNSALTTIPAFSTLTNFSGFIWISGNHALSEIIGFNNISGGLGYISITGNNGLLNISGFNNVTNIDQYILIDLNPSLTNITGFASLQTLDELIICCNDALAGIDAFNNLQSSNDFSILDNPSLCFLNGFEALSSVGYVNVFNNDALYNCCLLNCVDITAITSGNISISNNARGCNSLNEIESLCNDALCNDAACQIDESDNCGCPVDCQSWPQAIYLNPGWNLISLDIIPTDNSIQNVFADQIASGNLEFISAFNNGTTTFDPNIPPPFNTLQEINDGFGYWVKVTNMDFLPVEGICLEDSFRKSLDERWNLIAYPPDAPQATNDYFADLIANENLEFVTGFDAGTKTFDPALPDSFNTLQQLENGFGYWVKVTNATE